MTGKSVNLSRDESVATPLVEISVVVPAYNEERRLPATLETIWQFLNRRFTAFELIVVDDGSTDDTADVVRSFAADHRETRLVPCATNRGKGHAVRCGVLASTGRYLLVSDADLSTPISECEKLLDALRDVDVAIGSRAVRQTRIVRAQPIYRVLLGKTFNKLVRLLAVPGINDTQCGFKCFRGDAARALFRRCRIDGFGFDVEVLFLARKSRLCISEIGVQWSNSPESKVHPLWHSLQMLGELLRIRFGNYRD